ncbi:LOW QUALITY PROTEIN: hypothetical protein Dda_4337 [Drechslerella dactyloides]|uniref:Thiolase-like protein type 1 additional C-terminal domain-containing protein n=1 Tax=Drechslerella dactyloides TaxID=74499 RepID=A0AAD6J0Y1_DREDA|nr:LOW QUALITY PROTEIN: hypothetical protein Dda_4337 [Drechslerella dactyloides]
MNPMAVPVIIGVADVVNRSTHVEDAIEPVDLMRQAVLAALADAAATSPDALTGSIDSVATVHTWTWPYPDLPGLLAAKLGVKPSHTRVSPVGGNQPALLFDEAARRIAAGQARVAVVAGGEALASLTACAAAKKMPPPGWTKPSENVANVFSPTTRDLGSDIGARHDIGAPIHVYPLFENAFRAHRGQSIAANNRESARLYAHFAQVAAKNPYAWNNGSAATEDAIATVGGKNRMICFPYPLLMNAFNTVNLAAAVILTSTEHAARLGVPEHKWIYPLGAAGTQDSEHFWQRPNYHSSPAISRSLDAALRISNLTPGDIDLYDLYSCFPIVPKLAAQHLGIDIDDASKPLTLLGGLTSFGGAGNNYSMHAITEMTRQLRGGSKRKNGLVLANGGVVTYQHVVCLSTQPRVDGSAYPDNPLPKVIDDVPVPQIDELAEGEAVIETYTVSFDRAGRPETGYIVGRLSRSNARFIANHADERTLRALCSGVEEPIGKKGWVSCDADGKKGVKGRCYFTFDHTSQTHSLTGVSATCITSIERSFRHSRMNQKPCFLYRSSISFSFAAISVSPRPFHRSFCSSALSSYQWRGDSSLPCTASRKAPTSQGRLYTVFDVMASRAKRVPKSKIGGGRVLLNSGWGISIPGQGHRWDGGDGVGGAAAAADAQAEFVAEGFRVEFDGEGGDVEAVFEGGGGVDCNGVVEESEVCDFEATRRQGWMGGEVGGHELDVGGAGDLAEGKVAVLEEAVYEDLADRLMFRFDRNGRWGHAGTAEEDGGEHGEGPTPPFCEVAVIRLIRDAAEGVVVDGGVAEGGAVAADDGAPGGANTLAGELIDEGNLGEDLNVELNGQASDICGLV